MNKRKMNLPVVINQVLDCNNPKVGRFVLFFYYFGIPVSDNLIELA